MKKIMILSAFILLPMVAKANCYHINDNDMKNNCLAMEKQDTSYCYHIRNSDEKNYCLAKLKSDTSYCYHIKSSNKKEECLTFVR